MRTRAAGVSGGTTRCTGNTPGPVLRLWRCGGVPWRGGPSCAGGELLLHSIHN